LTIKIFHIPLASNNDVLNNRSSTIEKRYFSTNAAHCDAGHSNRNTSI